MASMPGRWSGVVKISLVVVFAARIAWFNVLLRHWREDKDHSNASLDAGGVDVTVAHQSADIDVAGDTSVAASRVPREEPALQELRAVAFFEEHQDKEIDEFDQAVASATQQQGHIAARDLGVFDDLPWPQWILLQGAAVALVWAFLRWERRSHVYYKFAHAFTRVDVRAIVTADGGGAIAGETLAAFTIITAIASAGALFQTSLALTLCASIPLSIAVVVLFYFTDGMVPPLATRASVWQLLVVNVVTLCIDAVRLTCNPARMWRFDGLWPGAVFLPVLHVMGLCTAVHVRVPPPERGHRDRLWRFALLAQAAATVAIAWVVAWLLQLLDGSPAAVGSVAVGLGPFVAYGCWADRLNHSTENALAGGRKWRCA